MKKILFVIFFCISFFSCGDMSQQSSTKIQKENVQLSFMGFELEQSLQACCDSVRKNHPEISISPNQDEEPFSSVIAYYDMPDFKFSFKEPVSCRIEVKALKDVIYEIKITSRNSASEYLFNEMYDTKYGEPASFINSKTWDFDKQQLKLEIHKSTETKHKLNEDRAHLNLRNPENYFTSYTVESFSYSEVIYSYKQGESEASKIIYQKRQIEEEIRRKQKEKELADRKAREDSIKLAEEARKKQIIDYLDY